MATAFPQAEILPKEILHETKTLQNNHATIMKHVGKYVLIGGEEIDYFPTYGEAATEGYKRFGLDNFLIKPVRTHNTPLRAMRCGVIKTDGKLRISRAKAR